MESEFLARHAREIFAAALANANAENALLLAVRRKGPVLQVGRAGYDLRRFKRVFVVGAGKAAGPMARGLERVLGSWTQKIAVGEVLVPPGDRTALSKIRKRAATHPIPSESGARGASQILDVLRSAQANDLVIALISGGASAMTALPVPGLRLRDLQKLTHDLLRSGASIAEINAVRKHLSQASGGRLAEAAYPARVLVFVASDVEGNHLDVIGSGPFAPDRSTLWDAERILRRYGLWARAVAGIKARIARDREAREKLPDPRETLKPGARCFSRVRHVIIADRQSAVAGAERKARALGFQVRVLDSAAASFGPIEKVAQAHLQAAARIRRGKLKHGRSAERRGSILRKVCLLSSGEAEVSIPRGSRGVGGRNQELALHLGVALARRSALTRASTSADAFAILCAGTDGIDGPTPVAGACVDARVLARARRAGLDPAPFIAKHDTYRFFCQAAAGLVKTGRTGTNLLDLRILLLR